MNTSNPKASNDKNKFYWLVKTMTIVGESQNLIPQLSVSNHQDRQLIALELAQEINNGRFDESLYGIPCFDVDGFIVYPREISRISEEKFHELSPYLDINPSQSERSNINEEVITANKFDFNWI
jgi:hypothetical protein